jgi:hypothetical protein
VKKAIKEILKQVGVIAFLCSVMLLSAPIISPDFDEWLTALVTMRAGIGNDAANFLLIMAPAVIGGGARRECDVGSAANAIRFCGRAPSAILLASKEGPMTRLLTRPEHPMAGSTLAPRRSRRAAESYSGLSIIRLPH